MNNLIKKVLSSKDESERAASSAQVAQLIEDDWQAKLEEQRAERVMIEAESLAARKAEYHRLVALSSSGEATVLLRGQIQVEDGQLKEILTEMDSFNELRGSMKSDARDVIGILCFNPTTTRRQLPSATSVRGDKIIWLSAYRDGMWFFADGRVHYIPQKSIDEFGEGTK